MKLYDLTNKYTELLNYMQSVDVTTSEQQQNFTDTLSALDGAIEDKAEGIVHILNQLQYDEETVDKEIKRLQAKKRALSNNQKRLKNYLMDSMVYSGKERIETPLFNIYTQNSPARMIVESEDNIPKDFYKEQQPRLDKKELREYLKENEIEGVRFEQGKHLRFR